MYRVHVWQCSGPCRHRPPYFGQVKRAMNRAPSPRDPWWAEHAAHCGGTYDKIAGPPPKRPREASPPRAPSLAGLRRIDEIFARKPPQPQVHGATAESPANGDGLGNGALPAPGPALESRDDLASGQSSVKWQETRATQLDSELVSFSSRQAGLQQSSVSMGGRDGRDDEVVEMAECPVCGLLVPHTTIAMHVDACLGS